MRGGPAGRMANQDEVHETREARRKGIEGPEREPMIYGKRKGKNA